MQIYPAIDIRGGKVVRLFEGERERETVYADDPVAQAERFLSEGAGWLHVVDMDRAFGSGSSNASVIKRIAALPGARIQVGGLLRTVEQLNEALDAGAARAVIATAAVLENGTLQKLVSRAGPDRAALAIDTRKGRPVLRGSSQPVAGTVAELARRARDLGVTMVVYRDLDRDGLLTGFDVSGAAAIQRQDLQVIVSGGGASLDDVQAARRAGLAGAILGRALYERRFTLAEAMTCSG